MREFLPQIDKLPKVDKFRKLFKFLEVNKYLQVVTTREHPLDVTGIFILGEDLDKFLSISHNISQVQIVEKIKTFTQCGIHSLSHIIYEFYVEYSLYEAYLFLYFRKHNQYIGNRLIIFLTLHNQKSIPTFGHILYINKRATKGLQHFMKSKGTNMRIQI